MDITPAIKQKIIDKNLRTYIFNIFIFRVLTPKANNVVIEDLPKKLPSVRNLASIFTPTKKSPEPLPRRSLIKVRTNSKIESV